MPTWLIIILFGDSGRRTFRPGHVAHPDFQGTPHRLRNFHQRKHAQTGYQMRRSGDPRTDDGTRRLRIGARMLGQLRRLHPRSGSRSTRLRKKIIGDKFSANRKHGQSEFRLPCFYFLGFNPTMPRGGQSAAEHSPTIISASDLQPGILRARQKNQELTRSVLL